MKKTTIISIISSVSIMLTACGAASENSEEFSFPIHNSDGAKIGTLEIEALNEGGVAVKVDVSGLTPGSHAMHFHAIGRCDGPDFKSSGGHYNPSDVPHGEHAGDMMNVDVSSDGTGKFNVTNGKVNIKTGSLPALMDSDGTALIIHAGEDDYTSQPSGAAGPRVACALIPAG